MVRPLPPSMRGDRAVAAGHLAFEHVHGADEIGDEARGRRLVDLGRRRHLHHLALVHDGDAVGHGHGLFLVVGDDHEGQAELLLQVHQLELRFLAQLLVERAERLVQQQHLRPLGDASAPARRAGAGRRKAGAACAWRTARASPASSISSTRLAISGFGMPSCFRPKAMLFSTVMCGNSA